ncbi:MAG: hypothetical protein HQL99_09655 [Magnetococcales bacterium]|nr:hypothetical protein [Magnetococcales bacterium]
MKITRVERIGEAELLQRFATTRLRGHGQPLIYQQAKLTLVRQVDPASLYPAQRYILREDHQRLHHLYLAFREREIDIFNLDGGLFFWLADDTLPGGEDGPIPLMPPVVELSVEPDGRTLPLINDGMHRVYTAMRLGVPLNIVLASDVPAEYPYYAFALEKGWDEVVELEELADGFVKKTYRDPAQYKSLFRDFNAVFEGIQKQRKQTNPAFLQA